MTNKSTFFSENPFLAFHMALGSVILFSMILGITIMPKDTVKLSANARIEDFSARCADSGGTMSPHQMEISSQYKMLCIKSDMVLFSETVSL